MIENILVIEDSKTISNIIKKELLHFNFEVSQAYTLQDAKDFLAKKNYQLIILDLHLPDGEGSELIANIQSLTKTKVVVLTSSQDDDLREELFSYGILDYIIKDKNLLYSISEIVKIIHHITTKQQDKILVIDDSKFICKQIKTILEPRNYKIHQALSAKKGLIELDKREFKLVILDMELPDMHGMQVLECIRKNPHFISLPILVLSGTSTSEIIRNSLKNGASDFLKKPFIFEELILKVDLWIDYFQKEKDLKEKTTQLAFMNRNLEKLVFEEVEKNREKDNLMLTQSRQAQMGEMIAMIAHQWRQPLNAISMAVGLIDLRMKAGTLNQTTVTDISQKINTYIQYLSTTIDDFREFFKPQKEMRISNLEIIVQKALALIEYEIKNKNIELILDVYNPQQFLTYENELVQVVISFLKNAEDSLLERKIEKAYIMITVDENMLSVEDNAGGIDEAIIEKIFDPYFSTKDKNGTGLGLYMSKMIVENHCQGSLRVTNTTNGAKFTIVLPYKGEE